MYKTYNPCFSPSNVNVTLRRTFEFIKANQFKTGVLIPTEVIMWINLIENQISAISTPKKVVSNNVDGEIVKVGNTYVVLAAKNSYSTKPSYYYISYKKIIYLDSYVISNNFTEYQSFMNCLPKICAYANNPDLTMLRKIKQTLAENADSNLYFQYIYSGIRSDNHEIKDYRLMKNLLTLEQFYITPITVINGYALIPKCEGGLNNGI